MKKCILAIILRSFYFRFAKYSTHKYWNKINDVCIRYRVRMSLKLHWLQTCHIGLRASAEGVTKNWFLFCSHVRSDVPPSTTFACNWSARLQCTWARRCNAPTCPSFQKYLLCVELCNCDITIFARHTMFASILCMCSMPRLLSLEMLHVILQECGSSYWSLHVGWHSKHM